MSSSLHWATCKIRQIVTLKRKVWTFFTSTSCSVDKIHGASTFRSIAHKRIAVDTRQRNYPNNIALSRFYRRQSRDNDRASLNIPSCKRWFYHDSRNYSRRVYCVNYTAAVDAVRTNRVFVIKDIGDRTKETLLMAAVGFLNIAHLYQRGSS